MVRPSPVVIDLGIASGGHKVVGVSCGDTHTGTVALVPLNQYLEHKN